MKQKKIRKADFCVIGAGSGGLLFAAGAVQMGASVILIERGEMGGDCLNYGCVPSKALIAAAKFPQEFGRSSSFGCTHKGFGVNFSKVHAHVHKVITDIAPQDSVERFEKLGVKVIQGEGAFVDANTVETRNHIIKAKRYIIATGSYPFVPPIPGLEDIKYYTNETIFNLKTLPDHLVIIGGGPIGIELAQAFVRLGSSVTILEAMSVLPKDDPEATAPIIEQLYREGVVLHEHVQITKVSKKKDMIALTFTDAKQKGHTLSASHVLVAAGRRPTIENLNLLVAGIDFTPKGITVDANLRTSNRRVYAIGDCIGGYQFTHVAAYHAGLVLRNSIFRLRSKVQTKSIPWVTYTDPELAHVGATEAQLKNEKVSHKVLKVPFTENDRAQTDRKTNGFIKVLVSPRGYVLGATILGDHAGELIFPWVMAIHNHLKVSAIANTIAPYPTLSEISKRAAGRFYAPKIFSLFMRKVVKGLMRITK